MSGRLPPIGFWSYASDDDAHSGGLISRLHQFVLGELKQKFGRQHTVDVWRDTCNLRSGAAWEAMINQAVDRSSFLIAIVTPNFLDSKWCHHEVMRFHAREQAMGRNDLVFPLHFTNTDDLDHDEVYDPALLQLLKSRQFTDFRLHRQRDLTAQEVRLLLDKFTTHIRQTLREGRTGTSADEAPRSSTVPDSISQSLPSGRLAAPTVVTRTAEPVSGTVERDGPHYPEMVLIPPGVFLMGVPEAESKREEVTTDGDARPVHVVRILRPFWLAKYPVTRGQYQAFVTDSEYDADGAAWLDPGFPQTSIDPVVNVSHTDAMAYVAWLSGKTDKPYRLPSEAEWEYAARAGTQTTRFWGNEWSGWDDYAVNGARSTRPVAGRDPNAFGLHDMLGHVWEWCADPWHDTYDGAPKEGLVWETNADPARRILRGGSWNNNPMNLRAGVRLVSGPGHRDNNVGFRPAKTFLTF